MKSPCALQSPSPAKKATMVPRAPPAAAAMAGQPRAKPARAAPPTASRSPPRRRPALRAPTPRGPTMHRQSAVSAARRPARHAACLAVGSGQGPACPCHCGRNTSNCCQQPPRHNHTRGHASACRPHHSREYPSAHPPQPWRAADSCCTLLPWQSAALQASSGQHAPTVPAATPAAPAMPASAAPAPPITCPARVLAPPASRVRRGREQMQPPQHVVRAARSGRGSCTQGAALGLVSCRVQSAYVAACGKTCWLHLVALH